MENNEPILTDETCDICFLLFEDCECKPEVEQGCPECDSPCGECDNYQEAL